MFEIEVFDDKGGVDKNIIDKFESEIGYKLPEDYKNLLSIHNALTPEKCDFDFIFKGVEDERDVSFLGYGNGVESYCKIDRLQQRDEGEKDIVVIGVSANGDYICFDYSKDPFTNNPPVILMFHDLFDENDLMVKVPVAKTFYEFVKMLE